MNDCRNKTEQIIVKIDQFRRTTASSGYTQLNLIVCSVEKFKTFQHYKLLNLTEH